MPRNMKQITSQPSKPKPTLAELRLAEEAYAKSHGRIVTNRELQREGFRMINDVLKGRMTVDDYERHWAKLCEDYRL